MAAKKKKTPATRFLRYEVANSGTPGTETSHYLDLAKDLSRINRRLYRQGRDYHVKRITIVSSNTPNGGNRVSFATAPDTWVSREAWKRGFKTWTKMNKESTMGISGSVAGTWSDFKVYLTDDMRTGNIVGIKDNGGNFYGSGEWVYSQLVSPDGTSSADEFNLHMLGAHNGSAGAWTSVGLVESYGDARATVQFTDPSVPAAASDDPLVNVFDDGTQDDEVIDNLEEQNDTPPYSHGNYPGDGSNGPKPNVVQDTVIVDGRAVVGGFNALCGLIEVEVTSTVPNDVFSILVELAPGNYRGIAAEVI
jgi:hypothetical protein